MRSYFVEEFSFLNTLYCSFLIINRIPGPAVEHPMAFARGPRSEIASFK